jgi:hypothetical protein
VQSLQLLETDMLQKKHVVSKGRSGRQDAQPQGP